MKLITLSITKKLVFILALAIITSSCKRQADILFNPNKLPADYEYAFSGKFEEYSIKVDKKISISGALFHCDFQSKGLVFYLHGNSGSIDRMQNIANVFLDNNYDFFMFDYRGFGKSQGKIKSEKKFHNDIQIAYDSLIKLYKEKDIVIVGYSIGSGPATILASKNNPKLLILKAPYYSIPDLAKQYINNAPTFLFRYKFETYKYITQVKCPITIFHGEKDEVIYHGSSEKLKPLLKSEDSLITLKNQLHNGIRENPIYLMELKQLLR